MNLCISSWNFAALRFPIFICAVCVVAHRQGEEEDERRTFPFHLLLRPFSGKFCSPCTQEEDNCTSSTFSTVEDETKSFRNVYEEVEREMFTEKSVFTLSHRLKCKLRHTRRSFEAGSDVGIITEY